MAAYFEIINNEITPDGRRSRWRLKSREGVVLAKSKGRFINMQEAKVEACRFARQVANAVVVDMTGEAYLDDVANMKRVVTIAMDRVTVEFGGPDMSAAIKSAMAREIGEALVAATGSCPSFDDGKHRCLGCGTGMVGNDD